MRAPDPPDFDLYETLELSPHASAETIDAAWKVVLRKHHPDLGGQARDEAAAKRINIAHDWLSDPGLRARYDATRPGGAMDRATGRRAASSFRPSTFRTAGPGAASAPSRPSGQPGRPPSPSPIITPPKSSAPTSAPTGMPPARPRRQGPRSTPRGLAFVVAILIGMLAGLLYLAPIVFDPRPSPTSPAVTPAPSRTPRVTRTATESSITWHPGGAMLRPSGSQGGLQRWRG